MIIVICITLILTLFILSTQSMVFQKKPISDILNKKYSIHEDIWVKKENNKNLLILLHGMYSAPEFYQETAEKIADQGWDVFIPVLPNASLHPQELSTQEPLQWEDSLKAAFQKSLIHNQNYQKIALSGHSQGGSLALSIAPSLPFLKGLIIVAAPVFLIHDKNPLWRNAGIFLSGILSSLISKKGVFLKKKNHIEKSKVENQQYDHEFIFGLTLYSMNLGLKKTRKNLSQITTPTFLIYEQGDTTVPIQDFHYIKKHLTSTSIKEKVFHTPLELEPYSSRHRLFNYIYTKDELTKEIIEFLKNL